MEEKNYQDDGSFLLIKFGSKDRLESLQKGCLYMKNLQYFIDLEKENLANSGGQGDMFEGQLVQNDITVVVRDPITHAMLAQTKAEFTTVGFGYQKYPVFCIFMLDSRNLVGQKIEGDKFIRSHQFTAEQVNRIRSEFGDHALMIRNYPEFIQRVEDGLNAADVVQYTKGYVQYYEPKDLDYIKDTHSNHLKVAFWKRKDYAFQQEFRILPHKKVDDHLSINIGDISDISQFFKTQDLLNSQIDFVFDVQNGVDTRA